MYRSMSDAVDFAIEAKDGAIGRARDFYFDDSTWTVRYLVVNTGKWLPGRRVLLAPESLRLDWGQEKIHVDRTRGEIEASPPIETDMPVSRRNELLLAKHYNWQPWWAEGTLPEGVGESVVAEATPTDRRFVENFTDTRLRSLEEVRGYSLQATDGRIGHVEDLQFDPERMEIGFLVVDTRRWLPGRTVVLERGWIRRVDWAEQCIQLAVTKDRIRSAPAYDTDDEIDHAFIAKLREHFGLPDLEPASPPGGE